MKENLTIIIFTEREFINGEMEGNTVEIGKMIRWRVKETSLG